MPFKFNFFLCAATHGRQAHGVGTRLNHTSTRRLIEVLQLVLSHRSPPVKRRTRAPQDGSEYTWAAVVYSHTTRFRST